LNAFNLKKCTSLFGSVGFLRNEHFQISLIQSRGLIYKVLSIWFESSPAPGIKRERERERERERKRERERMAKSVSYK
jgi:hypothetical protein